MAWVAVIALAAAVLGALWFTARPGRGALQLVAAMLVVALAGYAWQGSPALPGRPTPPRAGHPAQDMLFAEERGHWLDHMGADPQALDTADAFIRNGDPAYAIGVLRGEISRRPDSMMLWLGLGNALATYADGTVTPPALYAYQHAAALAPGNPAPPYFLGLAYAGMGDPDSAERIWRGLLAAAPADAPWRARVTGIIDLLDRMRARQGRP